MPTPVNHSLEMNQDNLWAVWSKTPDFLLGPGSREPAVDCVWILASPGPAGLDEIASPMGFPHTLVAAVPFSVLKSVAPAPAQTAAGPVRQWIEGFFGKEDRITLVRQKCGRVEFTNSGHPLDPSSDVLMDGSRSDLETMATQGREILQSMDYKRVFGDVRPESPEHPARWLYQKRDPAGFQAVKSFMDKHRNNLP